MKLILGVMDIPYSRSQQTQVGMRVRPPAAPGNTTTGDVAEILEARYRIMEKFYEIHGEEIAVDMTEVLQGKLENLMMGAPGDPFESVFQEGDLSKVEERFRTMLDNRELDGRVSGVPTQAAQSGVSHRMLHPYAARGARPSFIDTGTYQASMRAWVEE